MRPQGALAFITLLVVASPTGGQEATGPTVPLKMGRLSVATERAASAAQDVTYWVQVGAFRNPGAAARLAAHLRQQQLAVRVERADGIGTNGETFFRVLVGPISDRLTASASVQELQVWGYAPFVVVKGRNLGGIPTPVEGRPASEPSTPEKGGGPSVTAPQVPGKELVAETSREGTRPGSVENHPFQADGEQVTAAVEPVTLEEGRLSVSVRQTPLKQILAEISRLGDIQLSVEGSAASQIGGEPITAAFKNVTLEEGLARLLRNKNYLLVYSPLRLAEIRIYTTVGPRAQERTETGPTADLSPPAESPEKPGVPPRRGGHRTPRRTHLSR